MTFSQEPNPARGLHEKHLVSVIIRTKDRPDFLSRALASLAAQSYSPIEVVVVNDGEVDVTGVCASHSSPRLPIRCFRPNRPRGKTRAANAGLEAASGDYLIFLDDDDWFYPGHLDKLAGALDLNPACGLAYTGVECLRLDATTNAFVKEHIYDQPFDRAYLLIQNYIPIHAAMFRRHFVDQGLRLNEDLNFYEDWDFWLQLNALTQFLYVPGISACYYLGASSGYGVTASTGLKDGAENIFFSDWRNRWSNVELLAIINYARKVPELRQLAHDSYLKFLERKTAHELQASRYLELEKKYFALRRDLSFLEARAALCLELEAMQGIFESQKERLALLETELVALKQSNSWRFTAPLRATARFLRNQPAPTPLPPAPNLEPTPRTAESVAEVEVRLQEQTSIPPAQPVKPAFKFDPASLPATAIADIASSIRFAQPEHPVVSVIIPAFNHLAWTLCCLESISRHGSGHAFEVIVVDDASTDDTASVLSTIENLRLLKSETNSGFVHSCNRGAAAAKGEFLLFLNNDTLVESRWLDALAHTFEIEPATGIAGAKLIYPSGYLQEAGATLNPDGSVTMIGLNQDPLDRRYCFTREVDHCSGAALMIRKAVFDAVGGFDPCYAPAYFEDCDLSLKVRAQGYKVIYQHEAVVYHFLSVTTDKLAGGKLAQIERNKTLYLARWQQTLERQQLQQQVRLIAFFLPQYHPIPENDAWWGKGFTEWTNVTKAKPLFDEHHQPQVPADLGHYDLRLMEVREQQAALAQEYGVHGFCYYYYWFNGKKLLERPLHDMLASGKPDLPFCVCWANENWTRRWDGLESEVLMAQQYSPASYLAFIEDLLPVLADRRYIRVNGKPLLLIYRANQIPDLPQAIQLWRNRCKQAGFADVYLAAVESFDGISEHTRHYFDAIVEFPPHNYSINAPQRPAGLSADFAGELFDYELTIANYLARTDIGRQHIRTAMPSWDNTARRQHTAHIYLNTSPRAYSRWLDALVKETKALKQGDERIVFVNAWNEWAEGNHLEPDLKYGLEYLEATRAALHGLTPLKQPLLHHHLLPGLNLVGHPYAVLGRAEDIRTAANACAANDIAFSLLNLHGEHGVTDRNKFAGFTHFGKVTPKADHKANLFLLNADEMASAKTLLGDAVFGGHYNIGCFAWELSHFPAAWHSSFERLDEIWAPTQFIQQAISAATALPVVHMPFAIEPGPVQNGRAAFGLPSDHFLFLFLFDFRSYLQRKNPAAAINAFLQAFPRGGNEKVKLVIKVNGIDHHADKYQAFCQSGLFDDPRVVLLDQVMDDAGINALVACCDCFVSLHRSEGFGRGLAEAMYYGKPVIGTAYSGNLDFMHANNSCLVDYVSIPVGEHDYPFGAGQHWADADVAHAAWYMRKLFVTPAYASEIGQAAAHHIRMHHSFAAVGAKYRDRLQQLGLI
ncbi:MAG TPA: glycoside hydrolase family 99-like domain-containing protein [Candidatus Acidoferrum sp.]|nr:glycoside hydrolase family 99-like domain-containing protein [Candidatus Acidoferrum sp.]